MTKQEAIEILRDTPIDIRSTREDDIHTLYATAQGMAIEALQQGCDDLISRSKAIRWVKAECNPYGQPTLDYESGIKVIEHLERMPSAQPYERYIAEIKIDKDDLEELVAEKVEEIKKAQCEIIQCKQSAQPEQRPLAEDDYAYCAECDPKVNCLSCGHHIAERPLEVYCNVMCKWVNEKDCCTMFEPGQGKTKKTEAQI